eukprot:436734_1
MGIPNLLKELRVITKSVSLSNFSGETCGVDASCWLHRASHSCALALVSGRSTTKYLEFTLRCIQTLLDYNITPIIVFDGAHLPMKANEEHRRNQIREDKKKEALRHIKSGNKELAYKAAASAVRITKQMVTGFINQCIGENIQFICAPYEADSQLGYMYKNNQIDFVITEDSDLLLFGVQKALYKFDPNKKCGQLINMNDIYNYKIDTNITDKKKKTNLCLFLKKFWTKDPKEFIYVCVLSGCDYVKNLGGIGLKTAVKYCTENRKIEFLLHTLMNDKFDTAPKDYRIQFKRAVLTFLHQRVYDLDSEKLVHLNPLTSDVDKYLERLNKYLSRGRDRIQDGSGRTPSVYDTSLDFLGKNVDDDMAKKIAQGKVDARSRCIRNLISVNDIETERECVEDNGNRNRFFAPVSVGDRNSNNNEGNGVFGSGSMTQRRVDMGWKKKKGNYGVKGKKYFGALMDNDDSDDGLEGDGCLGDLMTQFGYKGDGSGGGDDMDMNWGNTEDMDEKDENEILVEDSDIEEIEIENFDNKPLKRNRKRKRDVMDEIPVQNVQKNCRRRLNNGNVRNVNNSNTNNKMHITPRNTFRKMDKNCMETPVNDNNDSIISDLFSTNKKKKCNRKNKNKNNYRNSEENMNKKINKNTPHNPFSLKKKKKNNISNRKAIAMIGDENKPIHISDSESESESESYNDINNKNITNAFAL